MERTALGAYLRTTQAWSLQFCEKETLDYGIAYVNPRYATLHEACEFREVVVQTDRVEEAFEQTEHWFAERRLRCLRWAAAEMQSATGLEEFLVPHGFKAVRYVVLGLSKWIDLTAAADVRILPARAMRSAFRATFTDPVEADAFSERLDDPQLDVVLAVGPGGPVGRAGLYQVGDIARVIAPVVSPDGDLAVERQLMAAALGLAKRLALKTVLIQARLDDPATIRRFGEYGFSAAGEFVEFDRDPSA